MINFIYHYWNAAISTATDPIWLALCLLSGVIGFVLNPFEVNGYEIKINNTKAIVYCVICFLIMPGISFSMFLSHW